MAKIKVGAGDIEYGNGVCIECGFIQDGCEPDARNYECEDCGRRSVFGLEEAILMDAVEIDEDADLGKLL